MALYRRIIFLLTPPVITLVGHLYLAERLVWAWPGSIPKIIWLSCVALMYACITAGFLIRHDKTTPFNDRISWVAFTFLGLFSWLFVLTLLRDVLLFTLWLGQSWPPLGSWDTQRTRFYSALLIVLVSLTATVVGFFNARRTPKVVEVEIKIAGLPDALNGFSIAQITDLHIGSTIKKQFVQRVVRNTNALDCDVIALTGDLIDGDVLGLAAHTQPLSQLEAPWGVYAVTGNHEYYSGAEQWVSEYTRLGMHVLQNEHVVLAPNQETIVLAGVTDYDAGRFDAKRATDPKAALAGSPNNAAIKILLAHQPRSMWAAAEAGFDLQLSGHTHGGQFWPWGHFVRLQQPLVAGLHRHKQLHIYISQGTGYWGPPMRVGAQSEITHIRLRAV